MCGDIRGNLLLFSLPRTELSGHSVAADLNVSPMNYFKGAHGISSVCSVSVAGYCSDQVEVRSVWHDSGVLILNIMNLRILNYSCL